MALLYCQICHIMALLYCSNYHSLAIRPSPPSAFSPPCRQILNINHVFFMPQHSGTMVPHHHIFNCAIAIKLHCKYILTAEELN